MSTRNQYPTVFDKDEDIAVGDSTLVEAASVLQDYSFVSREDDADDWDLMGAAYEQFTHVTLKRSRDSSSRTGSWSKRWSICSTPT